LTITVNAGGNLATENGVAAAAVFARAGSPAEIPLAVVDPDVQLRPAQIQLTFTPATATTAPTITRGDGLAWADDGFAAGQVILVSGPTANHGSYQVATVSGDTLTITGGDFVAEAVLSGVDVTAVNGLAPQNGGDDL